MSRQTIYSAASDRRMLIGVSYFCWLPGEIQPEAKNEGKIMIDWCLIGSKRTWTHINTAVCNPKYKETHSSAQWKRKKTKQNLLPYESFRLISTWAHYCTAGSVAVVSLYPTLIFLFWQPLQGPRLGSNAVPLWGCKTYQTKRGRFLPECS